MATHIDDDKSEFQEAALTASTLEQHIKERTNES